MPRRSPEPSTDESDLSIKDSLKQQGVRLTRQRQILLDLIDQSGRHLDAESLCSMAQEKDPKLNRVTVYRTLKLLKKGGLDQKRGILMSINLGLSFVSGLSIADIKFTIESKAPILGYINPCNLLTDCFSE